MVDPQKDLGKPVEDSVVKHLDGILAKDSPLMERARTRGFQIANSRGLLNSSIAAGAAMGEMIDRATPIAQQEASQGFGQNQQRREFEEGARVRGFQAGEAALDRALRTSEAEKDRALTASESQRTRDFSSAEAQRDREQQTLIANMNLDATERQNLSQTVAQLESLYASQYQAILSNTELNKEQRTALIESLENTRRQRIDLAEQVYDVKVTIPSVRKVEREAERQDRPKNPKPPKGGEKPKKPKPAAPKPPKPSTGYNANLDR